MEFYKEGQQLCRFKLQHSWDCSLLSGSVKILWIHWSASCLLLRFGRVRMKELRFPRSGSRPSDRKRTATLGRSVQLILL